MSQSFVQRLSQDQLQARAGAGDPDAMHELGTRQYGSGAAALAAQWWARAAGHGHAVAMFCLGVLYARGEGVRPDTDAARQWWSRAAAKGVPQAIHNMKVLEDAARGRTDRLKGVPDGVAADEKAEGE